MGSGFCGTILLDSRRRGAYTLLVVKATPGGPKIELFLPVVKSPQPMNRCTSATQGEPMIPRVTMSPLVRQLPLLAASLLATLPLRAAQDTDHDGLSDDWERGVGRYEIVPGSFTWQEAKADAELRGGHLATIVSDLEWSDMKGVLGTALYGKNLWLGGTDEGTEGTWRWITGEPWKFSNWRLGEPGNDSLGNGMGVPENYLMIWGNETASRDNNQLFWNDATVTGGVLARDGY
ncbi:MAG TPA: hypothetical protein DCM86_03445, partial [Verrucomicrobiales bacterium]|nr:hypothetical protein [Verrucomicrobiales bacterium]